MPAKTRHKHNTRHPSQLSQKPQLREFPQRSRRFPTKKPEHKLPDLYCSDEENSEAKNQEEDQESVEALSIKAEESNQDSDSKNHDNAISGRPKVKSGRKCKKQEGNQVPVALNTRSKKIANEIGRMGCVQSSCLSKIDKGKSSNSKNRKKWTLLNSAEQMIAEEIQVPPNITLQDGQRNIVQNPLIKEDGKKGEQDNSEKSTNGPFLILRNYRYKNEKRTQKDNSECTKKIVFEDKLKNDIRQHILRKTAQEQPQLLSQFYALKDYLFQKCQHMDQNALLSYKQTQEYTQILHELINLHPYTFQFTKTKKKLDLQIVKAVSQSFLFTTNNDRYKYVLRSAGKKLGQRIKIEQGSNQKNQTKNSESKQALSSSLFSQGRQQRSNEHQIKQEYPKQQKNEKIEEFIGLANQHHDLNQDAIEINQHSYTPSHSPPFQTHSNYRQTISNNSQNVKIQQTANQQESAFQPTHLNKQALVLPILESTKVKIEASEQNKAIQQQGGGRTQQMSRGTIPVVQQNLVQSAPKQQINFSSDNNYESKYSFNQVWDVSRKGSRRRLQILNRFQYNPFELDNGEDQCELWKRLMADEFDDLRDKYKHQGPSDFILQQLKKQYILPAKVKQEDFFVPTSYDPQTKSIKQEMIESQSQSQAILKEEPVDQNLQILQQRCQKQSQIQKQKCGQREEKGYYIPLSPFQLKLDKSVSSFDFNLLQDFQVSSLMKQSHRKVNQIDFYEI